LALASRGYRPVPLYNGCTGAHEVVDQSGIIEWLIKGANFLASQSLDAAPPAFLLDCRRAGSRSVKPGDFDNRWRVYPQDFPSPEILLMHGIKRAVVLQRGGTRSTPDLAQVLARWKAAGVGIEGCDVARSTTPAPIAITPPWWYHSRWSRLLDVFGLNRGPKDGFGNIVPEPTHG
jgi:hypothetical protein